MRRYYELTGWFQFGFDSEEGQTVVLYANRLLHNKHEDLEDISSIKFDFRFECNMTFVCLLMLRVISTHLPGMFLYLKFTNFIESDRSSTVQVQYSCEIKIKAILYDLFAVLPVWPERSINFPFEKWPSSSTMIVDAWFVCTINLTDAINILEVIKLDYADSHFHQYQQILKRLPKNKTITVLRTTHNTPRYYLLQYYYLPRLRMYKGAKVLDKMVLCDSTSSPSCRRCLKLKRDFRWRISLPVYCDSLRFIYYSTV